MKTIILRVMMLAAFAVLFLLVLSAMTSCRSVEYVTVPEVHTEYKHSVDTIIRNDSVIVNNQVVVREVDSATMAQYGITLNAMQKAWLIDRNRLEQTINQLREVKADTVHVTDSIPFPVEIMKEVPAELTWWQQARLHLANIILWLLLILAVFYGLKHAKKIRNLIGI